MIKTPCRQKLDTIKVGKVHRLGLRETCQYELNSSVYTDLDDWLEAKRS